MTEALNLSGSFLVLSLKKKYSFYLLFGCLVAGSHVSQDSLMLALVDKDKHELLILPTLSAGIIGVHHHSWFMQG